MKAMEKDRTRRYETAHALAEDIERHLNNEPVLARPPSKVYRFQKLVRRNKGIFAAVAVVAAVLVLGVIVSTWQAVRATQAEQARNSFAPAGPSEGLAMRNCLRFRHEPGAAGAGDERLGPCPATAGGPPTRAR